MRDWERPGVHGILLLHFTSRFYFLQSILCLQDSRIQLLGNLLEDVVSYISPQISNKNSLAQIFFLFFTNATTYWCQECLEQIHSVVLLRCSLCFMFKFAWTKSTNLKVNSKSMVCSEGINTDMYVNLLYVYQQQLRKRELSITRAY